MPIDKLVQFGHSRVLVTGGAGFVGSALIRTLMRASGARVLNVDKLSYAANPASLSEIAGHPQYEFVRADISDGRPIRKLVQAFAPDAIVHLAAESHVDRSIDAPANFIETNVLGTYTLLEAASAYLANTDTETQRRFRFLHVSTDEVYGSLELEGAFTEESPYRPNSPY